MPTVGSQTVIDGQRFDCTAGLEFVQFSTFHLVRDHVMLAPDFFRGVISQAFVLAVLVAVESLRTINIASSLTGERTNPNGELMLQGGVNIAIALVESLPASGNSFYSSENALLARRLLSGFLQSVFLVGFLVLFAHLYHSFPRQSFLLSCSPSSGACHTGVANCCS